MRTVTLALAENGAPFAQTPSGWITGALIPVLCVVLGYVLFQARTHRDHIDRKFDDFETTLATQSEALSLLVHQVAPVNDRFVIVESNQNQLYTTQEVLKKEIQLHKEWAKENLNRLEDEIKEKKS